jgi:hypothetical protein
VKIGKSSKAAELTFYCALKQINFELKDDEE